MEPVSVLVADGQNVRGWEPGYIWRVTDQRVSRLSATLLMLKMPSGCL